MESVTPILLCSSSPTRAWLLKQYGIPFEQRPVAFDEERIEATRAEAFAYHASKGKLEAAQERYGLAKPLLTADSVVVAHDGTILRKARNREEARETLLKLSGATIAIITSLHYKTWNKLFVDTSATHYRFYPFDREDLEHYLLGGDWEGKAGACMVEGFCKPYIRDVRGWESTAMGLQVERLIPWLEHER